MAGVLIIEDDGEINRMLSEFLRSKGYRVAAKANGMDIRSVLEKEEIDLILLDLMLPYKSGDQVLAEIRRISAVPVLVISAKDMIQTKVDLLRLGADDYITKPFDLDEVLARIESHLRRVAMQNPREHILKYRDLALDLDHHTAQAGEREAGRISHSL